MPKAEVASLQKQSSNIRGETGPNGKTERFTSLPRLDFRTMRSFATRLGNEGDASSLQSVEGTGY